MNDYDDEYIGGDFHSIVAEAQYNELVEVEKARDRERERTQELVRQQNESQMTLMQIAGLKTQRELEAQAAEVNEIEDQRLKTEEAKRKEAEHARLTDSFPPPDIKHS